MRLRRSLLGDSFRSGSIWRAARNGFIIGVILAAIVLITYLVPRLSAPLEPATGMAAGWLAGLFCLPFGQFYAFGLATVLEAAYHGRNQDVNVAVIILALLLNWLSLGALVGLARHEARQLKRPAA